MMNIGGRTLGEEYCDIQAVSVTTRSEPSQRTRNTQTLYRVMLPYMMQRLKTRVQPVRIHHGHGDGSNDNKTNRMVLLCKYDINVMRAHFITYTLYLWYTCK
jgi:hypothetical protein